MYRVYDDRTNITIFTSEDKFECMQFMLDVFGEDSEDFKHIWLERV